MERREAGGVEEEGGGKGGGGVMNIYDKNGIPIFVGDTVKVFHFVGSRQQQFFMYKYVKAVHARGAFSRVCLTRLRGCGLAGRSCLCGSCRSR